MWLESTARSTVCAQRIAVISVTAATTCTHAQSQWCTSHGYSQERNRCASNGRLVQSRSSPVHLIPAFNDTNLNLGQLWWYLTTQPSVQLMIVAMLWMPIPTSWLTAFGFIWLQWPRTFRIASTGFSIDQQPALTKNERYSTEKQTTMSLQMIHDNVIIILPQLCYCYCRGASEIRTLQKCHLTKI